MSVPGRSPIVTVRQVAAVAAPAGVLGVVTAVSSAWWPPIVAAGAVVVAVTFHVELLRAVRWVLRSPSRRLAVVVLAFPLAIGCGGAGDWDGETDTPTVTTGAGELDNEGSEWGG